MPSGDYEPRRALVGRLEQFETLEPLLIVNGAESSGKATSHLLTHLGGHGEGVDLDDGHAPSMPASTSGDQCRPGVQSREKRECFCLGLYTCEDLDARGFRKLLAPEFGAEHMPHRQRG